jgi:hypothetical protein
MQIRTVKFVAAAGLLVIVLATWVAGCFESNQTKAIKAIGAFHLAQLPASATNISFHRWPAYLQARHM